MKLPLGVRGALGVGLVAALALAGCGRADDTATTESPSGGASAAQTSITIGTSLPLTGALQAFGQSLQMGYQQAVDEANAAGGLKIGGSTAQVKLDAQDNASDGTKAASQAKSLVLDNGAVALLGPATPPLTIPMSVAAEQLKVPLVSTFTPIRAWLGANKAGYKYSYDVFFDELQMTQTEFQASDLISTNKKVALFTDQGEDGVVMGGLWEATAPKMGYEVVTRAQFPVGNTNFTQQVKEAKAAGADIVIAQVIPPDGISILREMKAQGWQPKAVFLEKAGATGGYVEASGGLAEGVMTANYFAEGVGFPMEADFIAKYKDKVGGVNANLGGVVYGYAIAKVLLAAIEAAGSTDAEAINAALAKTDMSTSVGQVKFAADHTSVTPAIQTQWKGNDQILILGPTGNKANDMVTPVPGLK